MLAPAISEFSTVALWVCFNQTPKSSGSPSITRTFVIVTLDAELTTIGAVVTMFWTTAPLVATSIVWSVAS